MASDQSARDPIVLMDAARIERTLRRMAFQLLESGSGQGALEQLQLIGLNERGYYLAGQIQAYLDEMIRNQHAGDAFQTEFHQLWIKPEAAAVSSPPDFDPDKVFAPRLPSRLSASIKQQEITQQLVLIDDVLFSGRSLAKAFSLLFDAASSVSGATYPRIRTAILIDRGHRRFPLYPELLGMRYPTKFNEHIEAQLPPAHHQAQVVLLPEFRQQETLNQ